MVFILYKQYFLSPYPDSTPHTKPSAILDLQKMIILTDLYIFYKIKII